MYKRNGDPLRNWKINICIRIMMCVCLHTSQRLEVNDTHTQTHEACVRDDTFENEIGFKWYTLPSLSSFSPLESGMIMNWLYIYVILLHNTNSRSTHTMKWMLRYLVCMCVFLWSESEARDKNITPSAITATTTKNNKIYDQLLCICVTYHHIGVVRNKSARGRWRSGIVVIWQAMLTKSVRFILVISINRISLAH